MSNRDELARRVIYCQNVEQYCRAGGFHADLPLHQNYGLPCVGGWIYWQDGSLSFNLRCVFCGGMNNG